jgi:nucleotide-binding universal stress UspA family protein
LTSINGTLDVRRYDEWRRSPLHFGASMYKNLLVATDGSKLSDKAVAHAIDLAQAVKCDLTAFYSAPDYPTPTYADGVIYEPVSRKEYTRAAQEN